MPVMKGGSLTWILTYPPRRRRFLPNACGRYDNIDLPGLTTERIHKPLHHRHARHKDLPGLKTNNQKQKTKN